MVRAVILYSNQHANKWCCAAETSAEFHRWKIHSGLDNTSPHFEWYSKINSIHELRTFGCYIYSIKSFTKKLDEITQEVSFMG